MTEPTYTAEQRAEMDVSRKLARRFSQMLPSDAEWLRVLHTLANELQLTLTAAEQREKELLSQLAAIRDAAIPELPESEFDQIHAHHKYPAIPVNNIIATLTRKVVALEAERKPDAAE